MAILSNGKFYGFLCSAKETGQKLANGAKEYVEDFISGFAGHGWKIWEYVKGKWMLEIDSIRVRGQFTVFEMLISKVRAIIGAQAITQGCGKIKKVEQSEDGTAFLITLEDADMSFMEHDFIRCQEFTGSKKDYHVEIESVLDGVIRIPLSEFDVDEGGMVLNPPASGDDIVQFGNSSHDEKYVGRHSAIYMHADEGVSPAIDVMDGIYSKKWNDCIKVRMGDIPSSNGLKGLYCVNGLIKGVLEDGTVVYQINPDGSASFARGNLTWDILGNTLFSGSILVKTNNDNVWEVNNKCVNIVGNKEGKHVELSPDSCDLRIYNENNQVCSIFEGNSYNVIDELYNQEVPTITPLVPTEMQKHMCNIDTTSPSDSGTIRRHEDFYPISEDWFDIQSEVTFQYRYAYEYALLFADRSTGSVSIKLEAIRYENGDLNTPAESYILLNENITEATDASVSVTSIKINTVLPVIGRYRLKVTLDSSLTIEEQGSTRVISRIRMNYLEIDIIPSGYISRIFANGLSLGDRAGNTFTVINEDKEAWGNYLGCIIENESSGIKITSNGLFGKSRRTIGGDDSVYGLIPRILAYGKIVGNTSSVYLGNVVTADGEKLSAERLEKGKYKVSFPEKWNDYHLGYGSVAYVTVTGYGNVVENASPAKASVYELTNKYFIINISDDDTLNDGSCYFELKLY